MARRLDSPHLVHLVAPRVVALGVLTLGVVALSVVALSGCSSERERTDYELGLKVVSDPGRPLAGATVLARGEAVGTSGPDGVVQLTARGAEGDVVAYHVTCPAEHRSPSEPVSVVLRRLSDPSRRPEYVVTCPPLQRTLVVSVRAERGPNLPVMYMGREVTRTDRDGAAHFVVKAPADETVELMLDTSDQPRLRPKNPTARFQVRQRDDVVVVDQSFQVQPPPRVWRRSAPSGPQRIGPVRTF